MTKALIAAPFITAKIRSSLRYESSSSSGSTPGFKHLHDRFVMRLTLTLMTGT